MTTIDLVMPASRTRRNKRGLSPFIPLMVALLALAAPTTPSGPRSADCGAVWVTSGGQRVITNVATIQVRRMMGQWKDIRIEPAC